MVSGPGRPGTCIKTKMPPKPGWHKKTVPGNGRFCGIAASKRLDNHQGCLRRFSLRSHQNRPLLGAVQSGSAKRPRPRWGLGPAGRSAKQSGRIFVAPAARAPGFWMKKAQRAAPQALVACGAALRVLCVKILQQNRRFLMPPRLWRYIHCTEKGRRLFLHFGTENRSFSAQNLTIL